MVNRIGLTVMAQFQSTLSMRRAIIPWSLGGEDTMEFQSTLSMRRAITVFNHLRDGIGISIHALHEESDFAVVTRSRAVNDFNPRSP